ncbi:SRPBCC domain-containing protein [Amycolatopsis sp. NPDC004625]|uniref:SRPBCC domain-containing protein n=1 Tax=Amycolatopsis sp. NPDC004625 TaxID=3154670 RepID=UPI0033ACD8BE
MKETATTLPDGRVAVRFERQLAHPRDKVWRALTETDQLKSWFVEILDYDHSELRFAPDAKLSYVADGQAVGSGTVTAYDPPNLLEYTWDAETLRFELVSDAAGCLLIFTNVVDGPETAAAVAPGWGTGLGRLRELLERTDALD